MSTPVKIVLAVFVAGTAAYFLIPEFRVAIKSELIRIFVPPPT